MIDATVAARGLDSPWEAAIQLDAATYGVPVALIKGVIATESAWDPAAVDPARQSYGLMQINAAAHSVTPQTALVPTWNLSYGTMLLAEQLSRRPTWELALAAYNAGTMRSDADLMDRLARNVNGVQSYVSRVLDYVSWYVEQPPPSLPVLEPTPTDGFTDVPLPDVVSSWPEDISVIGTIGIALLGIGLVLLTRR